MSRLGADHKEKATYVTMQSSSVTLPSSQSPDGTSYANLDSLGNHIYLEKQDKLRDLGINIQTSQVSKFCPRSIS